MFRDTHLSFGYIDERVAVHLQTVEGGCPPPIARNPLSADPTAFVTVQVDAGSIHVLGARTEHALPEPLGIGTLVYSFRARSNRWRTGYHARGSRSTDARVYSKSELRRNVMHLLSSRASFASVATAETHYSILGAGEGRCSAHMHMDDGFDTVC